MKKFIIAIVVIACTTSVFGGDQSRFYGLLQEIGRQNTISTEQLEPLGDYELRLLRNSVFAFHGRPFVSKELDFFFYGKDRAIQRRRHGIRFELRTDFKDSDLSEVDRKNVSTIFNYEMFRRKQYSAESTTYDETIRSYWIDSPDGYQTNLTIADESGRYSPPLPQVYKIYSGEPEREHYILVTEPQLISDSYCFSSLFWNGETYEIMDIHDVVGFGYVPDSMKVLYYRLPPDAIQQLQIERLQIREVLEYLYDHGIALRSANEDWFNYHLNIDQ